MSEENKIVELKEEELEKVSGGTVVTAYLFYQCGACSHGWHAATIQSPAYKDQSFYYLDCDVDKTCPVCGHNKCHRYIATNQTAYDYVCEALKLSTNN